LGWQYGVPTHITVSVNNSLSIHTIIAVEAVPTVNSAFSDVGGDLQTGLAKPLLTQHKQHPN